MTEPPAVSPWMFLLVAVAAFAATAGTLWGDWLQDDIPVVRDAERDPGGRAVLHLMPPAEPGAFRPVTDASLRLTRGAKPAIHHLINVVFHMVGCVLLVLVVRRVAPGSVWMAVGTALLFAVHPAHVRAVAPVLGRADVLALVFSCLAALAWWGGRAGRRALLPVAALAWFLAVGSHEAALAVPLLLVLAPHPTGRRSGAVAALVFGPVFALWFVLRTGADTGIRATSAVDTLGAASSSFGQSVVHWLVPVRLPVHRTAPWTSLDAADRGVAFAVLGVTVLLALASALGRRGWLSRAFLGAVLMFFVAVGVTLRDGHHGASMSYLVTVPLALLGGVVAVVLARARSWVAGVAGLLALAALTTLSVVECAYWRTEETRLTRRLALREDDVAGQAAFARYLRREAARLRRHAEQLPTDDPTLTSLHAEQERLLTRAREWARRATEGAGRSQAAGWRERGLVLAAQSVWGPALTMLKHAASLDARLADTTRMEREAARGTLWDAAETFFAIGSAHDALGQRHDAAEPFRFAALLAPNNPQYKRRAGLALARVGRYREGIPLLEAAYEAVTDPVERKVILQSIESERRAASRIAGKYLNEGRKAQGQGEYERAVRAFERTLEVNDQIVEAHMQVGWLRGWWYGNYALGFQHLERATKILEGARSQRRPAARSGAPATSVAGTRVQGQGD